MKEIIYYIYEEFRALGMKCTIHGPEFWLVAPVLWSICALLIILKWSDK